MASPVAPRALRAIMGLLLLILATLLVDARPALAQSRNTENTLTLDDPVDQPAARASDLAWLAGYWRGESSIGIAEEIWMAPSAGTMAGAFKVVRENLLYFYEFVEISEQEGSLTMRVKHFSPDLHGWEDKDEYESFPLVKLGPREAYFSGMTYRRVSETELLVHVAVEQDDGRLEEIEFRFERQENSEVAAEQGLGESQ